MGLQLHLQLCKRPYLLQHKTADIKSPCIRFFLYLFVEKCYCNFLWVLWQYLFLECFNFVGSITLKYITSVKIFSVE